MNDGIENCFGFENGERFGNEIDFNFTNELKMENPKQKKIFSWK